MVVLARFFAFANKVWEKTWRRWKFVEGKKVLGEWTEYDRWECWLKWHKARQWFRIYFSLMKQNFWVRSNERMIPVRVTKTLGRVAWKSQHLHLRKKSWTALVAKKLSLARDTCYKKAVQIKTGNTIWHNSHQFWLKHLPVQRNRLHLHL